MDWNPQRYSGPATVNLYYGGGEGECGLTKREHFAVLAMQGLLASTLFTTSKTPEYWKNDTIESAVEFADALLAELDKEVKS